MAKYKVEITGVNTNNLIICELYRYILRNHCGILVPIVAKLSDFTCVALLLHARV